MSAWRQPAPMVYVNGQRALQHEQILPDGKQLIEIKAAQAIRRIN